MSFQQAAFDPGQRIWTEQKAVRGGIMTDYERYTDYQPSDRSHVGLALTFLFVGLGAGALVGLLFAPKSGKQMRRTLKRKYEDARDVIEDYAEQAGDVLEKGAGYANAVKDRVAPIGKVVIKATK